MYYFKESGFLFLYSIMMSFLSLAAIALDITWLCYTLSFLSIAFMLLITVFDCFKEGEKACRLLYANDMSRQRIVETGEDIEIDTIKEYKPYKGFLIGLFSFAPMIPFLLVHLIIVLAGGSTNVFGLIADLLYLDFSAPMFLIFNGELPVWSYFIVLYAPILISVFSGIPYMLGARKVTLQYEKIDEKQKMIYGE